jgi:hypothetical protein
MLLIIYFVDTYKPAVTRFLLHGSLSSCMLFLSGFVRPDDRRYWRMYKIIFGHSKAKYSNENYNCTGLWQTNKLFNLVGFTITFLKLNVVIKSTSLLLFTLRRLEFRSPEITIFSFIWWANSIACVNRDQYSLSVHCGRYVLHKRKDWPFAWIWTQRLSSKLFSSWIILEMFTFSFV